MLYDPKWEHQTKADPLSLASLIAWLETMPSDDTYSFANCQGGCLVDQYRASIGAYEWGTENFVSYRDTCGKLFGWKTDVQPHQAVASTFPYTFGAALDRARKLVAQKS